MKSPNNQILKKFLYVLGGSVLCLAWMYTFMSVIKFFIGQD